MRIVRSLGWIVPVSLLCAASLFLLLHDAPSVSAQTSSPPSSSISASSGPVAWDFAAVGGGTVTNVGIQDICPPGMCDNHDLTVILPGPAATYYRTMTAKLTIKYTWTSTVPTDLDIFAIIPVGANPTGMAMTLDGAYVYVTNLLSNSVSVVSTATNTVVNTIAVGTRPIAIAITSNGTSAYVPNDGDNTVSVINIATNAVAATIPVQNSPRGVATTQMGRYVYVSNRISNTASVIDTLSNTVVNTVQGVALFPEAVVMTQIAGGIGCS
jgi:YVTN family beta-propeller protein